jgi:hypothetical protein
MRELIAAPLPEPEYAHHQSPVIRPDGLIFCSGMGERARSYRALSLLVSADEVIE